VREQRTHASSPEPEPEPSRRADGTGQPAPRRPTTGSPVAARALALQRLAGNRATASTLARWAAHPDPSKKGVIVPDVVATDFTRFNPPKNS
jgi:hypothetical protein